MKRIFVPTRSSSDWQRLLAKPKLHWRKGASAMTAAASWEDAANSLPAEIRQLLNLTSEPSLQDLELLAAFPEWEVKLPGSETTSNTDVLAICRNPSGLCVVAVEAKVHEHFGPIVGEKRASTSTNQLTRLQYLHDVLKVQRFDDSIRYQLLHRTASAILTASDFHAPVAVMLVQAFDSPADRKSDFVRFCKATGANEVVPNVFSVPGFTDPKLFLAWCDGNAAYRGVQLDSML